MSDNKIMFKVSKYSDNITQLEVTRTSEHNIWYVGSDGKETKQLKRSNWDNLYDTKEEAVSHIQNKYIRAMEYHNKMALENQNKLQKFNESL